MVTDGRDLGGMMYVRVSGSQECCLCEGVDIAGGEKVLRVILAS